MSTANNSIVSTANKSTLYLTDQYKIVSDPTDLTIIRSSNRIQDLFDVYVSDDVISFNINDLTKYRKDIYAAVIHENGHTIVARYIGANQWKPL